MNPKKIYFLVGGVRSGKSKYAEKLAKSFSDKVAYIATAKVTDKEMKKRISVHRKRRPKSWKTYEINSYKEKCVSSISILDMEKVLDKIEKDNIDTVIIDCITNLLFGVIDKYMPRLNSNNIDIIDIRLKEEIEKEIGLFFDKFFRKIKEKKFNVIMVSNEVGMGIVPSSPLGRMFRDQLGDINKKIASLSDEVYFFVAGLKQRLK